MMTQIAAALGPRRIAALGGIGVLLGHRVGRILCGALAYAIGGRAAAETRIAAALTMDSLPMDGCSLFLVASRLRLNHHEAFQRCLVFSQV